MKKQNKYLYLLVLPFLLAGAACDKMKDFGDTNVNPNGVGNPILSALFTNVEAGIGSIASQAQPGYYAQYFSETQYSTASLYSTPQASFTGYYSGSMNDLLSIATKNESNNLTQASRILRVYIQWIVTDTWGDVPYSESLKGGSFPMPKYDPQEEIYKGMLTELASAVASFDGTSVIAGDISNYKANVGQWQKLGNSLRLIMALQLSKKYPDASGFAATEFKAALTDTRGVIAENEDNFSFTYPGGNISNPWYNTYNGRKDLGESETMTSLMTSLGDTRQSVFGADVSGNPSSLGVPYGWSRERVDPWTQANPNWAYVLKPSFRTQTSTVVVIPASVVTLARAEAADRGWTSENVKSLYEYGVKLSFGQWGVSGPSDTYFTQAAVTLSAPVGTGANLKQIATQRYIATYPDGMQGWNLYRRTGFPVLTPAPDAVNITKQIPRRYTYASSEYSSNAASVNAAAGALPGGKDVPEAKIWWDQ